MKISAILLAAGSSSRLGRAKQLLQINGKSLIQASLENVKSLAISEIIVVLGARFDLINKHLKEFFSEINIVRNPDWEKGMSSSLTQGVQAIGPDIDGILICLSDQPLIPLSHFHLMIESFKKNPQLIVSAYNEGIGVPALLPSQYFSELLALEGKKGAKYLLKKYETKALKIPCPQAAFDIDTEEDYRRIVEMN